MRTSTRKGRRPENARVLWQASIGGSEPLCSARRWRAIRSLAAPVAASRHRRRIRKARLAGHGGRSPSAGVGSDGEIAVVATEEVK